MDDLQMRAARILLASGGFSIRDLIGLLWVTRDSLIALPEGQRQAERDRNRETRGMDCRGHDGDRSEL